MCRREENSFLLLHNDPLYKKSRNHDLIQLFINNLTVRYSVFSSLQETFPHNKKIPSTCLPSLFFHVLRKTPLGFITHELNFSLIHWIKNFYCIRLSFMVEYFHRHDYHNMLRTLQNTLFYVKYDQRSIL